MSMVPHPWVGLPCEVCQAPVEQPQGVLLVGSLRCNLHPLSKTEQDAFDQRIRDLDAEIAASLPPDLLAMRRWAMNLP